MKNNNEDANFNTGDTVLTIFDLLADSSYDNQITIKDRALTRQDFEQFLKERKQQEPNKYNFELMPDTKKKYENNELIDVIGLTRKERECAINDKIKKDLDNEKTDTFFKKILSAPYDYQRQSEDHTFGVIYGKIEGKPFMIKSNVLDDEIVLPDAYNTEPKRTVCFSLQHSQDTKSCGVMAYEILKHIETVKDIQEILDMSEIKTIQSKKKSIITQQNLMKSTNHNLRDIAKYFQFYVDPNNTIRKTQPNFFDNPKVNRRRFAIIGSKKKNDKDFYNRITNKVNLDKNTLTTLNFTAAEILKK